MKINIQIECETISEFYTHLTELQKQIKKKTRKQNLKPGADEFFDSVGLDDDNCYGSHEVMIKNH